MASIPLRNKPLLINAKENNRLLYNTKRIQKIFDKFDIVSFIELTAFNYQDNGIYFF